MLYDYCWTKLTFYCHFSVFTIPKISEDIILDQLPLDLQNRIRKDLLNILRGTDTRFTVVDVAVETI